MTKDEALKLALEALAIDLYDEARTVIKEALAQPEQEPVGQLLEEVFGRNQVMWFNKPKNQSMLYTTPPQRPWVGLTDDEINKTLKVYEQNYSWISFAKAISAKLKEKNTFGNKK